MDEFGYSYPPPFPPMRPPDLGFQDHGDGVGEYYGLGSLNDDRVRPSYSKNRTQTLRKPDRSRSGSRSSSSRSRSGSGSSRTASVTESRPRVPREPSFLDAFRVLYLTPSKHTKSATKYLATQKKQDRISEILKSDGLGSKRWRFYPRAQSEQMSTQQEMPRETCDQRVKIDRDFFRKYKRSKEIDSDAPIAKLKRWELVLYKRLGFIQAI